MLFNLILFLAIFALFGWIALKPAGGGGKQMQKRIERLKERKGATQKTVDMQLRRKTNEPTGKLLLWLMKPLPDFKKTFNRVGEAPAK